MAEKNYAAYEATMQSFRTFAYSQGWSIVEDKDIDYGRQIVVSDGGTKNPVCFYPSGKILVQGPKGALQSALLTWRTMHSSSRFLQPTASQSLFSDMQSEQAATIPQLNGVGKARIGSDESGKGDYFGPLVIAAVYVNVQTEAKLMALGVRDSKTLLDRHMLKMAVEIRNLCPHAIVLIGPKRYNELYEQIHNLNSLLAKGHAHALENVLEQIPCDYAIADQFGSKAVLENALLQRGRQIKLEQRPRAESDIAVAAASILARAAFVRHMEQLSSRFGILLPKGASDPSIVTVGRQIVANAGREALAEVAKLHFVTTQKILSM